MRRRRIAFSCSVLLVIALAASCREPTQITLRITSDEACASLSGVQVVVGPSIGVAQERFNQHYAAAVTHDCSSSGASNLIGTLVVTPGGHGGTVVVAAGVPLHGAPAPDPASCSDPAVAPSCIIARRSFSFIDHTSLTLPIDLSRLCVGKTCDPASTCFKGACVDSTVTCGDSSCDLGTGTGSGSDGGSSDGAYDADLGDLDGSMLMSDATPSSDAGDGGTMTDAGPDAMGTDAGSAICGDNGGMTYCYVQGMGQPGSGPTGVITSGRCGNPSDKSANCCRCTCKSSAIMLSCDVGVPSAGSCVPAQCP